MPLLLPTLALAYELNCPATAFFGVAPAPYPANAAVMGYDGEGGTSDLDLWMPWVRYGGTESFFVADDGTRVPAARTAGSGIQSWRPQLPLESGKCYRLSFGLPEDELLYVVAGPVCITGAVDTTPPQLGDLEEVRWLSKSYDLATEGGPPLVLDWVRLLLGFTGTADDLGWVVVYRVRENGPDRSHYAWLVMAAPWKSDRRYVVLDNVAGCISWVIPEARALRVGETEYLRVDPYDLAGNRGPSVYLEATWTGDATTSTVRRVSARRARRWGQ